MPRAATLRATFSSLMTDSVVLRRRVAGTFTDQTAQSCLIDWNQAGRDVTAGGVSSRSEGVPVYFAGNATVKVGDTFAVGTGTYRVEHVTPTAGLPSEASVTLTAWCVAMDQHGGANA